MSATNVRVVCRFRPPNQKEFDAGHSIIFQIEEDEKTVKINGAETKQTFTFDRVFGPNTTQSEVFEFSARPVIEDIMKGYNGTIFVYGQTSSGKTHTMQGPSIEDPELRGIIPRMNNTIFETVMNADPNIEFVVKASYVEIYMEKIRDLLDPSKPALQVREEKTKGIWVEGATEHYVSCEQDVLDIIRVGSNNRAIAETKMNFESSRSHSIFILTVQQRNLNDQSLKTGKLYLVDLAGSETVKKTGAQGTTLDEAKMINKSLSALGNVINALTDGKSMHIPYRDSKLTRVLQESLGGNSRTTLIVNCSPVSYNEAETISTLRFGQRAKSIKNQAKINQERSVAELKILLAKSEKENDRLQETINALQDEIRLYKGGKLPSVSSTDDLSNLSSMPNVTKLQDKCTELEETVRKLEEEKQALAEMHESFLEELKEKEQEFEQLDLLKEEINSLRSAEMTLSKENELLIVKLADITIANEKMQYESNEYALSIESLKAQNDVYQKQVEEVSSKVVELQSQLDEKTETGESQKDWENGEVEEVVLGKARSPGVPHKKAEESTAVIEKEIISSLRAELESYKREIHQLRSENEELQTKDSKEPTEPLDAASNEKKLENELRQLREQQKQKLLEFDSLKSALLKDLENRCQKVVELEILLDEAREQYQTLLVQMKNSNSKSLQQKCIFLQKSLEQMTTTQQQLMNENHKLKIDNQVFEKQLGIRNDRIHGLELLLLDAQEKLQKYANAETEYDKNVPKVLNTARKASGAGKVALPPQGRIVKPLRGGGGIAQPSSTATSQASTSQDLDLSSLSPSGAEKKGGFLSFWGGSKK